MSFEKKNLAICLTGQLRSWHICYKNFIDKVYNHNKEHYNIYLFMAIPNKEINKTDLYIDNIIYKTFVDDPNIQIPNFINAKGFGGIKDVGSVGGIKAAMYQLQNIYDTYTLLLDYEKTNNINFDIIMRVRNDVLFQTDICVNEYIDKINDNVLIIPSFASWTGVNDRFAIGNKNVMSIYMSMIKFANDYNNYPIFNLESLVTAILNNKKIKYFRSNKILFSLVRSNGNVYAEK